MQIINMYGRELGVNGDAAVMIDALRPVYSADLSIYGGTPLAMYKGISDTDAHYVSYNYLQANSLSTNVSPWGVADFNKNNYKDETFDPLAYNGSGKGEYRKKTIEVGSFSNNHFGLYDMHGNVWEWVEDCYHDGYLGVPTDGTAWTSGARQYRISRGGGWNDGPQVLRAAVRYGGRSEGRYSGLGFRLARTL